NRPHPSIAHLERRRDADDGKVRCPLKELGVGGSTYRIEPHAHEDFVAREIDGKKIPKELTGVHSACAPWPSDLDVRIDGEQRRRVISRRIGVSQAAAEGTPVPDLRVADRCGRVGEDRTLPLEYGGRCEVVMNRAGADINPAVLLSDAGQTRN